VFKATAQITITGQTSSKPLASFDISWVDQTINNLYYLADRSNAAIDIVDTTSNTFVKQIVPTGTDAFAGTAACNPPAGGNDCRGPNGVLTLNDTGTTEIWVGDGPTPAGTVGAISKVKVFTAAGGNTPTHTISTGGSKRADELCYDAADHLILVANDAETPFPYVSFIATGGNKKFKPYTVVGKITMDGKNGTPAATNGIEQCQWSPTTGLFYLAIPEVNGPGDDTAPGAVVVIDPKTVDGTTAKIAKIFNINHDDCAGPQGMALGPSNQILLGCNAPSGVSATKPDGNGKNSTVIINQHSGAIIAVLDQEAGADEVWFNKDDGHYFLARSGTTPPTPGLLPNGQQLGVVDARGHREDQSVKTADLISGQNAHSVAAATVNGNVRVYVPIPATNDALCVTLGVTKGQGCIAVFTTTHDDRTRASRSGGEGEGQQER